MRKEGIRREVPGQMGIRILGDVIPDQIRQEKPVECLNGMPLYKGDDPSDMYRVHKETEKEKSHMSLREQQFARIQEVMAEIDNKRKHLFFIPGDKKVLIESVSDNDFFRGTVINDDLLAITEGNHFRLKTFNPNDKVTIYFYSRKFRKNVTMQIPSDTIVKKKGVEPRIDLTKMNFDNASIFAAFVDSIQ